MKISRRAILVSWFFATIGLSGCGGGSSSGASSSSSSSNASSSSSSNSSSSSSSVASFTIGGSVSGLTGSGLALQNNAGDDLAIAANGTFAFTTAVVSGGAYSVTIKTQPTATPAESCAVTTGSGMVASANITSVGVSCHVLVAKFLYVPNSTSSDISAYSINAATGALTAVVGSPFVAGTNPSVAVSDPAAKYLYVAMRGSTTSVPELWGYSINSTTGALTDLASSPFDYSDPPPAAGLAIISFPLFHPSGAFGYVSHTNANRIYGATLNSLTGDLTAVPGSPYTVTFPQTGIFNAAGSILYVPNGPPVPGTAGYVTAYSVDATSGLLSQVGAATPTGGSLPGMARVHPNGKFLFVANGLSSNVAVLEANATTGALTPVAGSPFSTGTGSFPAFVLVHPSGKFLFVINQGSTSGVAVFAVNATSGALTVVPGSPFSTNGTGVINGGPTPDGKFFHVLNRGTNTIEAYSIDQTTGVLTEVTGAPYATENSPFALSPDPSGKYLYVANTASNTVSSYAINAITGGLTLVNTLATGTGPTFASPIGRQ